MFRILFAFFLVSLTSVQANHLGVVAGVNYNMLSSTPAVEDQYKDDSGLRYGVKGLLQMGSSLWLNTDLVFDSRTMSGTAQDDDYDYITLAPRLQMQFSSGLGLQVGARVSFNIAAESEIKDGTSVDGSNRSVEIGNEEERTQGLILGVSHIFDVGGFQVMPELLYDYALNDVNTTGDGRTIHSATFQVALLF